MKASEKAKIFGFLCRKGHMIEPSAPLVPIDDDSLLWINSGATLKNTLTDAKLQKPKIINSQKAIRTNDIETSGFAAHHTFLRC